MTRDDIIRVARDAGFDESNAVCAVVVRHSNGSWVGIEERLVLFATLVAAVERAACAKQMDAIARTCLEENSDHEPLEYAAAVIRARGAP